MSDPRLTYDSQSSQAVTVSYSDLPAGVAIVFVDEFGDQTQSGANLSGDGTADVSIVGLQPGKYHLVAETGDGELAQTVDFYVAA